MTRKLPWPANTIEPDVRHELRCEAKRCGVPMTAVLKAAIDEYFNRRLDEPRQPAPAMSTAA